MTLRWIIFAALVVAPLPAAASTFTQVKKVCPVGGEKFTAAELMSISTWGALPDGMPLGSGLFPVALTQCPGNGLVLYRDFTPADVAKLTPLVADPAYQAMRKTETSYYLAYWLATRLNDDGAPWLLLNATWQAKNDDAAGALARRYNEEFVALVAKRGVGDGDMASIALRGRAANTLRELGRFDEAEALRASIVIADTAGGADADAARNRTGWQDYLAKLEPVVRRRDSTRSPIDMIGTRDAALRCLAPDLAKKYGRPAAPLNAFEAVFCARSDMQAEIEIWRKRMSD